MARSVIVGDVHGCAAELAELLDRVAFATGDRLVLVGDLVARGPDSRGVLELVRRIGGRSVLGNHEQRLLEARAERASGRLGPRLSPSHERVLAELSAEDWELVESLPCRIDLPPHELSVVHAGIVPGVPLAEQDPWVLTHLRTIDDGGTPSARLGPPLWGTRYTGPPHIGTRSSQRVLSARPRNVVCSSRGRPCGPSGRSKSRACRDFSSELDGDGARRQRARRGRSSPGETTARDRWGGRRVTAEGSEQVATARD